MLTFLGSLAESSSVNSPDMLFIGSPSSLSAYDVERNADLFFKDVQDGVNTLCVGKIANISSPLVLVGGNCSILGFNHSGTESFWTVVSACKRHFFLSFLSIKVKPLSCNFTRFKTGDNVSSLAICDTDNDGENELLVGSDDFEIR
jgi:Bardet-Biedl syndrome 2 protein